MHPAEFPSQVTDKLALVVLATADKARAVNEVSAVAVNAVVRVQAARGEVKAVAVVNADPTKVAVAVRAIVLVLRTTPTMC